MLLGSTILGPRVKMWEQGRERARGIFQDIHPREEMVKYLPFSSCPISPEGANSSVFPGGKGGTCVDNKWSPGCQRSSKQEAIVLIIKDS